MVGRALGDAIGEPALSFSDKRQLLMEIERAGVLRYTDDTAMAIGLAICQAERDEDKRFMSSMENLSTIW